MYVMYVEGFMARVQADPTDQSVLLVVSAFLASDHIRLFGPGEAEATSILAPKKSTVWDTTVNLIGFTVTITCNGREDCRHQT